VLWQVYVLLLFFCARALSLWISLRRCLEPLCLFASLFSLLFLSPALYRLITTAGTQRACRARRGFAPSLFFFLRWRLLSFVSS
jgi:hypothetical protein